jgi:hypothetical protein
MSNETKWLFVIDTNEYAGNFERQLCAFLTGRTGDCEVGQEQADMFNEEYDINESLFDNVIDVMGDDGCNRPVQIWQNPKHDMKYTSVGIWFESKPTKEQIKLIKKRVKLYCKNLPKSYSNPEGLLIEGFRIIKEDIVYTTVEDISI